MVPNRVRNNHPPALRAAQVRTPFHKFLNMPISVKALYDIGIKIGWKKWLLKIGRAEVIIMNHFLITTGCPIFVVVSAATNTWPLCAPQLRLHFCLRYKHTQIKSCQLPWTGCIHTDTFMHAVYLITHELATNYSTRILINAPKFREIIFNYLKKNFHILCSISPLDRSSERLWASLGAT